MIIRKVVQPPLPSDEAAGHRPAGATLATSPLMRSRFTTRLARGPRRVGRRVSRRLRLALMRIGIPRSIARRIVSATFWLILIGLVWFGAVGARAAYSEFRARRLYESAFAAMQRGDLPQSAFALYLLLGSRADHLAAHQLMAEVAERAKSPQAIYHRHRVAELAPSDPAAKVAWANAALRFNQLASAGAALDAVPPAARGSADYLGARAQYDLLAGRLVEAETSFAAVVAQEPANSVAALKLAVLKLQRARDPASRLAARNAILELLDRPECRLDAARALTVAALQDGDREQALRVSRIASTDPQATIADRLLNLGVVLVAAPLQLESHVASVKARAAAKPAEIFEVGRWLLAHGRAAESEVWLASLPEEVRAAAPVQMVRADGFIATGRWLDLEALTAGDDSWGPFEAYRLAYGARAAREQDQAGLSRTRWLTALRAAGDSGPVLRALIQVTGAWNWRDEHAEAEWSLMRAEPAQTTAILRELYDYYRGNRDAPGLRRVFEKIVELRPDDVAAKRNLAMLYLIGRVQLPRAHELALEVRLADETNLDNLIAFALSLHVRGETAEALRLLETRRGAAEANPYFSAYYGIMLASVGRRDEARRELQRGLTSELLPEESSQIRAELARL